MTLQEARNKLDRIKNEIAKKEGEYASVMSDLQKDFNVKTIDEAYDKYDTTKDEISAKKKEKDELIKEVEKQITSYGF